MPNKYLRDLTIFRLWVVIMVDDQNHYVQIETLEAIVNITVLSTIYTRILDTAKQIV
jgi:hypothetical protein